VERYSLSDVAGPVLLRDAVELATRGRGTDAHLIAHIGEIGARKLYLPLGYHSLLAYCMGELGLKRAEALARIRVARVARRLPVIFEALADNRLNMTAVILLNPYWSKTSVDELIVAAAYKDKPEIRQLIADRFPKLDVPAQIIELPASPMNSTGRVCPDSPTTSVSPETPSTPAPELEPLSSSSFAVHYTMSRNAYDQLRYVQQLLSHELPSGDVAQVMEQALDALAEKLEKRKFAATDKPRRGRPSSNPRHIRAEVKRQVWERDAGRCTFHSDTGRRCDAREQLEYDHILEVARGGEATVENIRLRCRAHNQFTAERTFGAEFMENKRRQARAANEKKEAQVDDVVPWLRALGIRADDAKRAAERCESIPDAPLEQRVKLALRFCGPRGTTHGAAVAAAP